MTQTAETSTSEKPAYLKTLEAAKNEEGLSYFESQAACDAYEELKSLAEKLEKTTTRTDEQNKQLAAYKIQLGDYKDVWERVKFMSDKENNLESWADASASMSSTARNVLKVGGVTISMRKMSEIAGDISADDENVPRSSAVYSSVALTETTKRFRRLLSKKYPTMRADKDELWSGIITPILLAFAIVGTSTKTIYNNNQRVTLLGGETGKQKFKVRLSEIKGMIVTACAEPEHPNVLRKFLKGFSAYAMLVFKEVKDQGYFNHLSGKWAVPQGNEYLAADFLDTTAGLDDNEREILRLKTRAATSQTRTAGDVPITSTAQLGRGNRAVY